MPNGQRRGLLAAAPVQTPQGLIPVEYGPGSEPMPAPYRQGSVSAQALRTYEALRNLFAGNERVHQALAFLPQQELNFEIRRPNVSGAHAYVPRDPETGEFDPQRVVFSPSASVSFRLIVHELGHLWDLQTEDAQRELGRRMDDYYKQYKEDVEAEAGGFGTPRYQLHTPDDFFAERFRLALSLHASPNTERRDEIIEQLRKDKKSAASQATVAMYDAMFGEED